MKKLIYIMGISLFLTGCSSESVVVEETYPTTSEDNISSENDIGEEIDTNNSQEGMYVNNDMKEAIKEINALQEKYADLVDDNSDDRGPNTLYINMYDDNIQWAQDIRFNNQEIYNKDYFDDLIQILDKSIAKGLKDYVEDLKNKPLEYDHAISKKIGRSIVYTESRGQDVGNYIYIKINLLDISDDYYRDIFDSIADDKYILGKVVVGEDLTLLDFANMNGEDDMYQYDNLNIRYNMFFKDKDFKKINILLKGKNGEEIQYDDVGVFINLLNTLDINEQKEKDALINEYKNVLKDKSNSKKVSFDNYDLLIKSGKGNLYSENDTKLVYFSIQAK